MMRYARLCALLLCALPAAVLAKTWVIFNNSYKGAVSLAFDHDAPCLTRALLAEWGVIPPLLDRLAYNDAGCMTPDAAAKYDLKFWYRPDAQLLTLLFPDAALKPQQNGVSTSRWDDGINALFVNYRLDVDNQRALYRWDSSGTDATLALTNGLNLGAWRLRYQNTLWRERDRQHGSYTNARTLWRSITALRSRLTFGDGYTSPTIFNSMAYTGASLASDEAMFPDSWRPYAPIINGYARTEAEVSLHQNGERVYRIHVPAGAFTIRDFYPPYAQGNLELTIQESDGTERTRLLPYTVMPTLVQHGFFSYELAMGRYKPPHGVDLQRQRFGQATLSWGATGPLTLFTGLQQSGNYRNMAVGAGGNLGKWGALSLDVSRARYTQQNSTLRGNVWRLRYAKALLSTGTSLNTQLQWYPKGSQYRSLEETLDRAAMLDFGWDDDTTDRAVNGLVEINQTIGEDDSISLYASWTRARSAGAGTRALTLSVNHSWRDIDTRLYASYGRYQRYPADTTVGISVSVPVSFGSYTTNVGYVANLASRDNNTHGVNIYGSALDDYSLRYDVTAEHTVHENDALNASLGWQHNAGEVNARMVRSGQRRDYHADASGSLLLHSGGLTAGQTLGNTAGLVEIPNTAGVGVYNQFGVTTNKDGALLVSYMTPWRVNRVTVDSWNLPAGMTFDTDELEAVPTDGAIVSLRFPQPMKAPANAARSDASQ